MHHETSLIATLALSLIAALIGALAATRLRRSPLVGYLLVGVLIGPFTLRLVPDPHFAHEIADVLHLRSNPFEREIMLKSCQLRQIDAP